MLFPLVKCFFLHKQLFSFSQPDSIPNGFVSFSISFSLAHKVAEFATVQASPHPGKVLLLLSLAVLHVILFLMLQLLLSLARSTPRPTNLQFFLTALGLFTQHCLQALCVGPFVGRTLSKAPDHDSPNSFLQKEASNLIGALNQQKIALNLSQKALKEDLIAHGVVVSTLDAL